MAVDDREYFKRRAEAERQAAAKAKDNTSCRAHMTLAKHYDWRVATEPRDEALSVDRATWFGFVN
jgi:hypothetical protein